MKSFNDALAASKAEVMQARQNKIDSEKTSLLEALKDDLMITCKLKELPHPRQVQVLNLLTEMWSPKTGINKKGRDFLAEGRLSISEKSTPENIRLWAVREVKAHINEFMSAFSSGRGSQSVDLLCENIQNMTGKKADKKSLTEMCVKLIADKMKADA